MPFRLHDAKLFSFPTFFGLPSSSLFFRPTIKLNSRPDRLKLHIATNPCPLYVKIRIQMIVSETFSCSNETFLVYVRIYPPLGIYLFLLPALLKLFYFSPFRRMDCRSLRLHKWNAIWRFDYGIGIFWTQVVFKYVFYNYRTVDFHQNFLLDCYIFLQNKSFQWLSWKSFKSIFLQYIPIRYLTLIVNL